MRGRESLSSVHIRRKSFNLNHFIGAGRTSVLLGITLLLSSFDFYQPDNLVKKYGVEQGLSLGIITSITQDNRGLMWFATEDGLNRFDGYSFKVYKYDPERNNSLTGNFISQVYKDSKGIIWITSRHGLNKFDPNSESFLHYRYNPRNKGSIAGDDITAITESASGNLWIGSYNAGFSYYDREKNTFTPYGKEKLSGLNSNKILKLYEDKKGLLWVGTQDAGIKVFRVKNGVVLGKVTLPLGELLNGVNIKYIYEDRSSNIWVGTSNGLFLYQRDKNKLLVFRGSTYFTGSNIVLSILEDSREMLWVGVQDGGAYTLDLRQLNKENPENLTFVKVLGKDGGLLTHRSVQALYEDKDRNMWVGTYGEGISMISDVKEKFIRFRMRQNQAAGSVNSSLRYYGICTDAEDNLWLGTDGDGIYKCNERGEVLNHYSSDVPGKGLTDNAILCAFKDSKNKLWFGSYSQGLFLYRKETDSFVNYKHNPSDRASLGGNDVRVVFEDSKKNIWVGTNGGGLSLFNPATQTFRNYTTSTSKITSNDVRSITEDKLGRLWIGTYGGGLTCYTPQNQKFIKYPYKLDSRENVSSNVVLDLFVDAKQNLWIGTEEDGLIKYDLSNRKITQYSEKSGLANNTIYAIQSDLLGNIWVSTNKGLSKLDVKTSRFYNYGTADGLQAGQFNPGSVFVNRKEGVMGFGGTKGLNIFYPAQLKEKMYTPKVLITGLQLFHTTGSVQSVDQRIEEGNTITLNPDEPVFTIEFGALDYARSEKNKYMYKLEGLDENWNYVGNQRSATYRYLEPGEYTFLVKASDQENNWGEHYTSLRIKVLPPIWRTTTAYFIYLLIFGGLAYVGFDFYNRQRKLRRRLLVAKAQSRKERRAGRERLSFFTEVSHEFRTPLTLMLGPLEEMLSKESGAETGKKLQMVYKNAHKLLGLINKLLDYRKAEAGSMVLKIEEVDLVAFVQEICINFQDLAQKKHINFSVDIPSQSITAWFDKEKVEMVLNNLLSNAFKYIGTGNAISVKVSLEESFSQVGTTGFVKVEVTDNGVGIPVKQQKHIFDWFYQGDPVTPLSSGLGLALAKKLVLLHKGQIYVQSKEGSGATFGFQIPLGNHHFDASTIVSHSIPALCPEKEKLPAFLAEEVEILKCNTPKKGQKKILIVEDEEDIRKFLKYYLQESFCLIEATNGKEGIEQALSQHPDIIISDVKMPEMNGIDMCRELKTNIRTSHIPIVLLTARTALTHHKEGLETGADAYLTKPFSPELLQIKLRNLLDAQEKLKKFHLNLFSINAAQPEKQTTSLDEKFLKKIFEVLKENLENSDFNVNELAAALNMSRSLAYKKIKSLTGVSPVEYLRSLRLQESARLLRTGEYKVFEVASQVGFNDEKYFRQCFTKEFGCTPSEFIKTADVY